MVDVADIVRTEQIHMPSEPGVVLAGELRVPTACGTRCPVVLLLGGGGASPHGIYPLLEARFHRRGIATLSFDKRGVGRSTGTFVDAMGPAEGDARAALRYLRSRGDAVDVRRIAVLGLSQGAVIAPVLATESPSVIALVLLAAPAGHKGRMFLDAMREKLTTADMRPDAVRHVVESTRQYLDALTGGASAATVTRYRTALVRSFVAGGWSPDHAEGAVKTLGDPATSSLYTVAANAMLSRVKVPVLALYAANDTVVSSPLSIPEARRALVDNPDATIREMPEVEHGFKPLVMTASGDREYAGWPISDPATLEVIENWLVPRLSGPARRR